MSEPDFIQRNGAFLLTMAGIMSTCGGAVIWYLLRSRCTEIKCCGCSIKRDPLDAAEFGDVGKAPSSSER